MFFWISGRHFARRPRRTGFAQCIAIPLALVAGRISAADASAAPAPAAPVEAITSPAQVWGLSPEMKLVAHPLRIEGRVSFYDPPWRNSWIEKDGVGTYLQLSNTPPALRAGQHALIEGSLVPSKGLDAGAVTVKILQEYEPVVPLDTKGRIREVGPFSDRVVSVEAYVDGQQSMDRGHLRLALVVDDFPVIGWLKPDDPGSVPNWQGKFVRLIGLYSDRFDPTGTDRTIELWISRQSDLTVIGSLAGYPGFDLAVTPINKLYLTPAAQEVHVRGRVQTQEVGPSIVIRDQTGQVVVQSAQRQRFPFGTEVEAVGRVAITESQWNLQAALYRRVPSGIPAQAPSESPAVLENVGQIRQLTSAEAARGRRVDVSGTVVWTHPDVDFFFLQDVSGGIRVHFPREKMDAPRLLQYAEVEGETFDSGFAPAVELKHFRDRGAMGLPPAKPVTFDQAITGAEDGQWVEMRGFFERTESEGDQRRIYVATPTGEFVAHLDSPVDFAATPGSLIRIRGVCETEMNGNRQITGLRLWVPFLHSITVDDDAPIDPYDLPLRSITNLGHLSAARDLMRVRVAGVVLHAVPGRQIHLQDDRAGLLLLSSETEPLAVGDSVEVVGILGREGMRTVLREAVYRRRGPGPPPAPLLISDPSHFAPALDERLVTVRGTLIDELRRPERTHLTVLAGTTLFEAVLEQPPGKPAPVRFGIGAVLELTGIYRIDYDDARQVRGFQLQLRSPADVVVVQAPRLWTVQRALAVAAILGACALLSIAWGTALRRRVRQQTGQIREQLEHQARLEAEVERTARLESLGVLAGGIAHDFNNLLTIVNGNLSLAMTDGQMTKASGLCLREIEKAAFRARDLTQQLLTFAKGGVPLRSTVALPELVRTAAESVLHGSSVRCDFDILPGLWSADVDRDQISQAIQNIVINAMQAMPHGGVIRILLANDEIAPGAKLALTGGRYVRVAIADSGVGIKPEILPRIFDPFFSTKKTGSGLGLATAYSIIKRHEGCIEVQSAVGQGATFTLWLPAAEGAPKIPSKSPLVPASTTMAATLPSARVLLMDDEEGIRQVVAVLLEHLGLDPTVVMDGAEAVREFMTAQAAGRPFELLILDLTIRGGMGGRETIEIIRKLDPEVPAIVASGYSNDPVLANFASYGFQAIAPKPFAVGPLTETIRRLLEQRR
jgi:two-component system, cell cycle sensor histidine kinase and response regulator CckA